MDALSAPRRPPPLALVEAVDRDGEVRQAWRIEAWPITIGRALDNDVVLTDPHVAAHHAMIDAPGTHAAIDDAGGSGKATPAAIPAIASPAAIVVTAGGTRNGLAVGGQRLAAGEARSLPDSGRDLELQFGRTTLRLRLGAHPLAPELALAPEPGQRQGWLPTAVLGLGVLAIVGFNSWLHADPDTFARAAGNALLTTLSGGAIWCGLWALLSKLLTRRAHLRWHARVFTLASLILLGIAALSPLLAFAFSAPWVTDFSFVAVYAAMAVALYFHLLAVEPARRRLMQGIVATAFVAGVALSIWFNLQRTARPGEELYMSHLLPPQLRAARPVPVDAFVARLAPLQAVLDRQAQDKDDSGNDAAPAGDDE